MGKSPDTKHQPDKDQSADRTASGQRFRHIFGQIVRTIPVLERLRRRERISEAGFDKRYREARDPFLFDTNPYEQGKFNHLIETLDGRSYGSALEVGCAIGSFTEKLLPHCDRLLAIDISQTAVDRTRNRFPGSSKITVERATIPQTLPPGPFDLVVCSDVLYYLSPRQLRRTILLLANSISPGGTFLALHYLGDAHGLTTGNQVHDLLHKLLTDFKTIKSETIEGIGPKGAGYRIDRFDRIR